jgi:hypothetical protein
LSSIRHWHRQATVGAILARSPFDVPSGGQAMWLVQSHVDVLADPHHRRRKHHGVDDRVATSVSSGSQWLSRCPEPQDQRISSTSVNARRGVGSIVTLVSVGELGGSVG